MEKEYEKHEMEIVEFDKNGWIVTSSNNMSVELGKIDVSDR